MMCTAWTERGISRTATFNTIYGRCMRAQGYRARPYYKNWLPG